MPWELGRSARAGSRFAVAKQAQREIDEPAHRRVPRPVGVVEQSHLHARLELLGEAAQGQRHLVGPLMRADMAALYVATASDWRAK